MIGVVSSDWHPDAVTAGFPRFEDVAAAATRSVDVAIARGAGFYFFLGDLSDPERRSHECAALAIRLASRCADAGIWFVAITGNHDVNEDGTGSSTLEALHAHGEARGDRRVVVCKGPTVLSHGDMPFDVIALPYVPRSHAYDPAAWITTAHKIARPDVPVLVLGHLMLEGIGPGSETVDMARGRDLFFPVAEVLAAFGDRARMFNGHYHRRQVHRGVQVVGSLERLAFGEEDAEPGFLVVEVRS